MPPPTSAGLLLYRWRGDEPEVFLVHPGGPFWAGKDERAWSIPKGLVDPGEDPLAAAVREFVEETGLSVEGRFVALTPRKQPSGKVVHAFALEHDLDASAIRSNSFSIEWPPRSGRLQSFPEVDRAAWFPLEVARVMLHRGQVGFIDELARVLVAGRPDAGPKRNPKAPGRQARGTNSDR
jgi:predicted NUDIX family NTP pyrophosphohydrolase